MMKGFRNGIVLAGLLSLAIAPAACFAQEKAKDEPGKLTVGLGVTNQGVVVQFRLEKKSSNLHFALDVGYPNMLPSLVEQLYRKVIEPRLTGKEQASVIRLSPGGFDEPTEPSRAETYRELQDRSVELGLVRRVY